MADHWTRAVTKAAISEAADEIDRILKFDPLNVGEPIGQRRCLVVGPLEIIFAVSTADRMVRVVDVRLLPPSNGHV